MYVSVPSVEGPMFNITRANRLHMGAYLCIASNGVPPTVSKRIMLIVHCKYFTFSLMFSDGVCGVIIGLSQVIFQSVRNWLSM
jgi:hypothetical protein